MIFTIILRDYFRWHYSKAFVDIFHIWRNITHFVFHFFSISALFRTLFQPWKRIEAQRETRGFDIGDYLSTKMVNLMMRLVGFVMRLMLITIGFIFIMIVVIVGIQFLVVWAVLPAVVLFVGVAGLHLIFFV
ncbi:MAG: hypothetical protein KAR24_00735 [Candidatus Pacebacteria bacterium]|nr:hypothetical protein [Candidatus Paceibacterota bacterium]